jgi:hypothetical protein
MKTLLRQNAKMKASSNEQVTVVNWSLPAFRAVDGTITCPNAGACAKFCYARKAFYQMTAAKSLHNANLALTKTDNFAQLMINDINHWLSKRSVNQLKIRIHDNGDFYTEEYYEKWLLVMNHFIKDERVSFYAYTKQVDAFKNEWAQAPSNFHAVFSYGGKQDALINQDTDAHSRVFANEVELNSFQYVDSSYNDLVAANPNNKNIGLVLH